MADDRQQPEIGKGLGFEAVVRSERRSNSPYRPPLRRLTVSMKMTLAAKIDAILKFSIVVSVVLASCSVGYYYLVHLPQRDVQFEPQRVHGSHGLSDLMPALRLLVQGPATREAHSASRAR